ncbi:MAG: dTMP kinase [Actinomycetaceae bacterium]|nr:dTMP kinase [Arcanobacterium sp.]MDD7505637.1 dTMP kinase [Actinomycetaceae bacterium]MDY6143421.1 dTMP kinase [Arcanobacterium sp.]
MARGLFISFEGGDGTGKTTQIGELSRWLRELGYTVVTSREPGGTELGNQIRELLLHSGEVSERAEALLFAADRAHHVATKIRPALERGEVVITDRYFDSSIAYQGAARELDATQVKKLSLWATGNLVPRATILLDAAVEESAARVGGTKDRLEAEGVSFHQHVREKYLQLAAEEPERFHVVDAQGTISAIAHQIRQIVEPLLAEAELERGGVAR